jgi:thiamine biosynthesis protein ThiS
LTARREKVRIRLNGKEREVRSGLTVRSLLEELEIHPGMVVVELNRQILPRDGYASATVAEDDQIELVHFVGGG